MRNEASRDALSLLYIHWLERCRVGDVAVALVNRGRGDVEYISDRVAALLYIGRRDVL
jgi:hypothetical protein